MVAYEEIQANISLNCKIIPCIEKSSPAPELILLEEKILENGRESWARWHHPTKLRLFCNPFLLDVPFCARISNQPPVVFLSMQPQTTELTRY